MTDWTGAEIKRRRINAGLNQRQLGDLLGVTFQTVSRWEQTDHPNLDRRNRERLDQALPPDTPDSEGWTGTEIRRRRRLHGLTQDELAERVDASRRSVQDWEKGNSAPSGGNLQRLQEVLRLPEEQPSPLDGIPLREASFAEVVTRLIQLHNEQRRQLGQQPVLTFGNVTLPSDLPEHHTGTPDTGPGERANANRTNIDSGNEK